MDVSCLHFDSIDVQVRNIDISGAQAFERQLPWIGSRTAIPDLVAAAVGYRKCHIPAADAGEFGREIRVALDDQLGDVAPSRSASTTIVVAAMGEGSPEQGLLCALITPPIGSHTCVPFTAEPGCCCQAVAANTHTASLLRHLCLSGDPSRPSAR